ncbi:cilia- and flagella-associated protein 418-like isoform X2 [Ostrea edulis]|uniref:cilia- and flagella-associated protein 418-like isoform X2 n=1 Tax=Ostrea edulis TaxID=37623 RepID=UPI0024AFB98D|nr:cilia- and flagella-associated protein 418-like isoform X2 [Ostrea edulis]
MAEDIDDLLEEVESKFLTKDNKKTKSKSNRKEKRDNDYDIDDILDDIQVEPIAKGSVPSAPNGTATDLRPASGRKSCDKLRCTSCDFKVCSFDNYEWHPDTDYLFLRNNAPDYHRLKTNLVPKRGSRSYCCQCCLRSVQEMTKLADPRLKWVCGKH